MCASDSDDDISEMSKLIVAVVSMKYGLLMAIPHCRDQALASRNRHMSLAGRGAGWAARICANATSES